MHRLVAWLTEGLVLGHPFVQGELACGQMPRRAEVLALFEQLPPATVVSHREMLQFVDRHRLMGQGLGWIDLHLLASALVSHATLATREGGWHGPRRISGWRPESRWLHACGAHCRSSRRPHGPRPRRVLRREPEDYAVSDEILLSDTVDDDADLAALYAVGQRYGVAVTIDT